MQAASRLNTGSRTAWSEEPGNCIVPGFKRGSRRSTAACSSPKIFR